MDDRVVAGDLLRERRADGGPEVARAQPVGAAVDGGAVAEHHGDLLGIGDGFELALDVEDGTLLRLANGDGVAAGEAASEDDARRFGQDLDMRAE